MALPRRTNPLLARALNDTELQLGPQSGALVSLLHELASNYSGTRRVNASNARQIAAAAQEAQPQVGAAFDQALASVNAQRAALGVGPQDAQAQAYERRVGEQKANALTDLVQEGARATTGKIYANDNARSEYMAGKQKIQGQQLDLLRQSGALTASTLGKLRDDQLDRGIKRGADAETARHNRVAEATAQQNANTTAANAAKTKSTAQWATPDAHGKARDGINAAIALIKQQQQRGMTSRAEIIQILTTGRAKSKVKVDGTDVTVPEIPKLPADLVRAATNLVYDKSLSAGDVKRLHDLRLKVKTLGFPVRPKVKPRAASSPVHW